MEPSNYRCDNVCKTYPRAYGGEIVDSYERMRCGWIDIGKIVGECSLGGDKAARVNRDDIDRSIKQSHCVPVGEIVICTR